MFSTRHLNLIQGVIQDFEVEDRGIRWRAKRAAVWGHAPPPLQNLGFFGVAVSHFVFEMGARFQGCQNWVCGFVFFYVHESAKHAMCS